MLIDLKNITLEKDGHRLLDDVEFHVDEGEFIYIIGKVGAGKSSLLKTIYGELPLKNGEATVLDYNLCRMKRRRLPELRKQMGMVFQDFQLLRDRTVQANLDFVLRATGWKKRKERSSRIEEVLTLVGMQDKAAKYPHELSGGEQQRAAIARALLNTPKIILADEPTGNLDQDTGNGIVAILKEVCTKGTAVVMVTHNLNLLQNYPGIVYRMDEGKLQEVTKEYNTPFELA
ncbi:MAG: ATP-binding cassette domain-containing protein [Alloprevotella sp.]|nr:ATP-binding cassette domain-containing protein [Alloprevotella sp.]